MNSILCTTRWRRPIALRLKPTSYFIALLCFFTLQMHMAKNYLLELAAIPSAHNKPYLHCITPFR